MEDRYFKCVFDTLMTGVANMRYFNVLDHHVEEREINHRSHGDGDGDGELGGDRRGTALQDLQCCGRGEPAVSYR